MAEQLICNQQVDGSTPFTSSSLYGGIPERPKGADCKSVVTDFAGPNPASPTITRNRVLAARFFVIVGKLQLRTRHLPRKCAGSHTPLRDRRARSSGAECGYLRFANTQLPCSLREYPATSPLDFFAKIWYNSFTKYYGHRRQNTVVFNCRIRCPSELGLLCVQ